MSNGNYYVYRILLSGGIKLLKWYNELLTFQAEVFHQNEESAKEENPFFDDRRTSARNVSTVLCSTLLFLYFRFTNPAL